MTTFSIIDYDNENTIEILSEIFKKPKYIISAIPVR